MIAIVLHMLKKRIIYKHNIFGKKMEDIERDGNQLNYIKIK